jgi:hydroxyacylglutathione hydrolase
MIARKGRIKMKVAKRVFMVGSGQIGISNFMDCHVYLIDTEGGLALIDAGVGIETEQILENIRQEGFNPGHVRWLLITHSHADHAGGSWWIRREIGCEVIAPRIEDEILEKGTDEKLGLDIAKRSGIYPGDYSFHHCRVDRSVEDGESLKLGKAQILTIQIPGHSWGSACYLLEFNGWRALFSSDVVFYGGTIGLGNWPGSNLEGYRKNIGKLANLGVEALFPGHFLWTLRNGQKHLDTAVENLKSAWVPPAWQHNHPHR